MPTNTFCMILKSALRFTLNMNLQSLSGKRGNMIVSFCFYGKNFVIKCKVRKLQNIGVFFQPSEIKFQNYVNPEK